MITFRLNLGNKCNLNCEYCYEKNRINKNKEMEEDVMDIILQYVNSHKDVMYNIIFFGGEPTLYIEKIEYFIKKCRNKNVIYTIFTNCANLKGLVDIEDRYDVVIDKIASNKSPIDLYNYDGVNLKQFSLILTPKTLTYITDDYIKHLFSNKNIQDILLVFCIESNWDDVNEDMFVHVVNKLNTYYLLNEYRCNFLYLNSINQEGNYVYCCTDDLLNIDTNGDVYLCNRHLNTGVPTDEGIIGNIKENPIEFLLSKRNFIGNKESSSQDCYCFSHLGVNRHKLTQLIEKTNLYISPTINKKNSKDKVKIRLARSTRRGCGSCSG